MSDTFDRFIDPVHGRRRVIEQLLRQPVSHHDPAVASRLAEAASLHEISAGNLVIQQEATDTDIYFILVGEVTIEVSGREMTFRAAGQHVGEMAMIDPTQRRSASVRARLDCVLAKVSEPDFEGLAEVYPRMWRALAVELGSRLRQRNGHVRPRNETPIVFVGSCSSAEGLALARALQVAFAFDPWVTRLWCDDGVFPAGRTPIESLVAQLEVVDFALFVVTPDDLLAGSTTSVATPRDNVIFELGLMIGALGRDRVFMVKTRSSAPAVRLPSDLLGVQPLDIQPGVPATLGSRIGPAASHFRSIAMRLRSR